MPRAYSEDLRPRVVADTDKGLSLRAVAEKYSVSPSFVSKLTRVWRREGSVATRQVGGYTRYALAEHADAIRHQLAEPEWHDAGRVARLGADGSERVRSPFIG